MYRGSEDTVTRAMEELRVENEQLRADVAAARRLARHRPWMRVGRRHRPWVRVGGTVAWLALLGAACVSAHGWAVASGAAESLDREREACAATRDSLARELWRQSHLVRERFEPRVLHYAFERCPSCASDIMFGRNDEFMPWDACVCR